MHEAPNMSGVGQEGSRVQKDQIEKNLLSPEVEGGYNPNTIQGDEIRRRADEGHPSKRDHNFDARVDPSIVPGESLIDISKYNKPTTPQQEEKPPVIHGLRQDGTLGIDFELPQ